jgi:hypothetical protein
VIEPKESAEEKICVTPSALLLAEHVITPGYRFRTSYLISVREPARKRNERRLYRQTSTLAYDLIHSSTLASRSVGRSTCAHSLGYPSDEIASIEERWPL